MEEGVKASADRIAATADRASASFARGLSLVLRETERNLRRLVQDAADGASTAIIRTLQAARTRKEIRQALADAGFDYLAETATSDPLDVLTARVLAARAVSDTALGLTAAFDQRIAALRALHQVDLLDEGDVVARLLWQAMTRGVFNSQPVDAILADLADVLDASEPRIRTLYDTSVSIYGRQVEALQAGDDDTTVFAYMGPADQKTRPFCLEHLGRVYTRADLDQLDNGQLDNVFLTGGGYNCRHVWFEVSKFSELMEFVGTSKRIPEIEALIGDLADAA